MEVVIVDDGSTDRSHVLIKQFIQKYGDLGRKLIFRSQRNRGKGGAVKKAFSLSSGDFIIIQDADLEYDVNDINAVLAPIVLKGKDVIYGSRRLSPDNEKFFQPAYYIGGVAVTEFTNLLFRSNLTDEPTCYKAFRRHIFQRFEPVSDGFEWEPEITAKILKAGIEIGEVPIRYFPRKVNEGKKIKPADGLKAFWTLFKYRMV